MDKQLGMAYLALLLLIAGIGAGAAVTSTVWTQVAQRENEKQLLRAGQTLQIAISQYYERSPGTQKRYPQTLDDLLLDKRYLSIQRYVRRIPNDPMTKDNQWGLVRAPDGGIMGVYSLSTDKPIKTAGFDPQVSMTAGAGQYRNWTFVYIPPAIKTDGARGVNK